MGLCSSTTEDANAQAKDEAEKKKTEEKKVSSGTGSSKGDPKASSSTGLTGEAKEENEAEFRETLRNTLLLVYDRMLTALGYEAEAFLEVAKSLPGTSAIAVCAPDAVEKLLRDLFAVDEVKMKDPSVPSGHVLHDQQKLLILVQACTDAAWRKPLPSRRDLVAKVQASIKRTQTTLDKSYTIAPSSDLKLQLQFFSRTLGVFQGDIGADGSGLLYDQIDLLGQ